MSSSTREADYRDQRNLTIVIPGQVGVLLIGRNGAPADTYFTGKKIAVHGAARRVKITFTCQGKPTEKYYYQTHVVLTDPDQIEVLPADAK